MSQFWDILPHKNSCNVAITNFLVSHMCEIRFHDVIGQSTVHNYVFLRKNSKRFSQSEAVLHSSLQNIRKKTKKVLENGW